MPGDALESILAPGRKREDPGLAWKERALRHLPPRQPHGRWAETASTTRRTSRSSIARRWKRPSRPPKKSGSSGTVARPIAARPWSCLRQARPKVLPGSRDELDYVIYKTENFVTVFEELSAADEAKAAFDRALLAMNAGEVGRGPQAVGPDARRRWIGPTGSSGRPPSR